MHRTFKISFLFLLITACSISQAQIKDSTGTEPEEDYSLYGGTEESVKYCTQKVRFLSPTKLISLGYEAQGPFDMKISSEEGSGTFTSSNRVSRFGGLRWVANAPVISNNRFILNIGASYYESFMEFENTQTGTQPYFGPYILSAMEKGIRTTGLNATAFKPLDEKHFLIVSAQGEFNGNFGWDTYKNALPKPTLTFAALYGWKKNENTMLAIGATQTWRGGEKLYVPLLLFNKTFNDHWGLEMLLPARAHVRYNFSPKSLLLGGFEIEGNSYRIAKGDADFITSDGKKDFLELRRSELKFRLMYEQRLFGFIWISVQGGFRYNYKFNISENRGSDRGDFLFTSKLGNPLYGGISLNLVSP